MKMTTYNNGLIPVGYLSCEAISVKKGDVVKDMGIIRKISYVGQHEFILEGNMTYINVGIEFQTLSVLTGRKLYFVLPMDELVDVMQYAKLENYEFEYLPLESDCQLFSSESNNFESKVKYF